MQADESLLNNDFVGANDYYWYYDEKAKEWKTYQYKATDIFNNRLRHDLPNYQGAGAKLPGAITAGQDSRTSPLVIAMPASQKAVYLSVNIVDIIMGIMLRLG